MAVLLGGKVLPHFRTPAQTPLCITFPGHNQKYVVFIIKTNCSEMLIFAMIIIAFADEI